MLLIVAHHYVVNSGMISAEGPFYQSAYSGELKSLFVLLFGAWGKTGINCFVLITGYFMCKSQITLKKFMKLLFEIMFYRIVINSIFWITSYRQFSLIELIKVIIPVRAVDVGFTSAYLVFFLLIPFLNVLVKNMTEKQHIFLLCLLSFTYIFLGTIPGFSVTMNYVSWFSVLYFIAAYIRLYPKKIFNNTKMWGFITIILVLVSALSVIVCTMAHILSYYYFVQDSNTLLAVLLGISSFLFFKNLKIKNSKLINSISATCFGVLLIHANGEAMRTWLWIDVLNNAGMYNSSWLVIHAFASVLIVFVVCSAIDMLRIKLIEKPFFCWYDKHYDRFNNWYKEKERFQKGLILKNNIKVTQMFA